MAVLQHYYTSFVNKETGSAGFQVKAMSPGISPDTQSMISRLIAYRIPPTLNEYAIETHPIALRYYYKDPHESILLCSQSNGNDENGRPGNFFAHTLVLEPDIFTTVPPVLYWRSPMWQTKDPGNRTQLAPLRSFDEDSWLDIEKVWEFLAQGPRRKQFYKLMSEVVHSNTTQRRIVIIDSADNVALWIAAVSCMLPPAYRPLLSFATYHHDPYQAQFMVTGTTSDSSFRATPEEYMSFFILNTESGLMSEAKDSPYARMAAEATRADLYEQQLLPLFAMSMRRFPLPARIDEQLDLVARYLTLLQSPRQGSLTAAELQAIKLALTGFEQLSTYDEDDVEDLRRLARMLSAAFRDQRNDEDFVTEYRRVVQLQKRHKIATEEYLLNELRDVTELLMGGKVSITSSIEELKQAHGEKLFVEVVNHAVYAQYLAQLAEQASLSQLQLIWELLGKYFRPGSHSQDLLLTSLDRLDRLWRDKRREEGNALAKTMNQAMVDQEHEWLKLAAALNASLPSGALQRFYYYMVRKLPLDERLPYRAIVEPVYTDIVWQELKYDIDNGKPAHGVVTIEAWVRHAIQQHYEPRLIVEQGLNALRNRCTPEEWRVLAPKILTSSLLALLPWELEASLAKAALSALSLSRFSPAEVELCKRYQNFSDPPEQVRIVIDGILAMLSGNLDQELARRLHQHCEKVPLRTYKAEVERFITEFFKVPQIQPDAHSRMVWALHINTYNDTFWQAYWSVFADMLVTPSRAERASEVLALWFELPPVKPRMSYVAQSFFFELPQTIEDARKVRGFFDTARKINTNARQNQWYPLVQPFFSERKNVFTSIGQSLATRFQKRSQNSEDAQAQAIAQKQAFDAKVAALFEHKRIKASHRQYLPALYTLQQRDQFWSAYWEGFIEVLVSRDADYALELLSFWFDDSFEALQDATFVVHDFFLNLREILEVTRKERGFSETAQQVHARVERQPPPWYPLVQNFFLVRERGLPGLGWPRRG